MNDPFKITGPTCISFSGGRTSAFMLYRVLQSNGGKLPAEAVVCFANTGKEDEGAFWRAQPFDLGLPNNNGVTMHGNCDLCFLKGGAQVLSLIAEKPQRAVWWAKMESLALASKPSGAVFRSDRPSYAALAAFAADQRDMFDPAEEAVSCFCGD